MLHVVTSTSAAARLAAAARVPRRPSPCDRNRSSSARRAARPTISRARSRAGAGATFGLTRFSLTELAARAAAAGLAGARRVPGTQAGAEAMAARAVFDAVAAGELAYFEPVARMPGFPEGAGADASRAAAGRRRAGAPARPRRAGTPVQPATDDLGRLLARVEASSIARRSTIARRCSALAADAWRAGQVRWAGLPIVLLDVPLDSRAEQEFVAALVARAPDGAGDGARRRRRWRCAALRAHRRRRSTIAPTRAPARRDLAHLRRYVFTTERPPVRERGRRRAAVLGAGRRARGGRDRPARARRGRARRAVRRDGGVPAHAAAVPRAARARLRARRRAGLLRSRHPAARSGRPRVRRAAVVRGRRPVGEAVRRIPVARPGAAGSDRAPRRVAASTPLDEVVRRGTRCSASSERRPRRRTIPTRPCPTAPVVDSDEEAIVAGTLRSPWKWEELIVESAVVGGRTRAGRQGALAAPARRPRRRLSAIASPSSSATSPSRRASRASSATCGTWRTCAQFALPIIDALAEWPERATWGEWLERFIGAGARARCARPARVLQTLAELRPMADVGPVTLEEARDVLHDRLVDARLGAAGAPLRPGVRRHAASGARPQRSASCSCPAWPSASCRSGRARIRCCSTSGGARSTRRWSAGRARQRRAAAAEDRDRRGDRAALSVVSAAGRRRNARARAVVLRARRDARDHRPRARPPRAGRRGGRGRRARAWPGRRRTIPIARSTISSTTSPSSSRCSTRAIRRRCKGHAHYLLGLNEALRRSVISRWARGRGAVVAERRPDQGRAGDRSGARRAPARRSGRIRCRRCSASRPVRISSCWRRFIASSRGTSPSRSCGWIR